MMISNMFSCRWANALSFACCTESLGIVNLVSSQEFIILNTPKYGIGDELLAEINQKFMTIDIDRVIRITLRNPDMQMRLRLWQQQLKCLVRRHPSAETHMAVSFAGQSTAI